MNRFRMKIGNIVTDVQSNHAYLNFVCKPYFSVEPPDCILSIDPLSVDRERESYLSKQSADNMGLGSNLDGFLEVYILLRQLIPYLPAHNMLFIHGSAIQYGDKAYIFVAPSGTGKSTHTRLWKERFGDDVIVINDDKPFLAFKNEKIYVCGTPWRGKHNIGQNLEVELGGIVLLSRGECNTAYQIDPADALNEFFRQCCVSAYKENTVLALDLIDNLLKHTPVYRLSCTPTMDAVDACYNAIMK